MRKSTWFFLFPALAMAATPAFAGQWCDGYGETVQEATDAAWAAAEKYVASRGKGCVSGQVQKPVKVGDLWHVQVLAHNQNGSCGHKSDEQKALQGALKKWGF